MAEIVFTPRPERCDNCHAPFQQMAGVVMVDGPSAGRGSPWGCFCWYCWTKLSPTPSEFGLGKGQRYVQNHHMQFVLQKGWDPRND